MKEKFIQFLVENDAYEQYMQNFLNFGRSKPFDEWFEQLENKMDGICSCFMWQDTPEGHEFWENLNRKWIKFVESYK